MEMTGNFNIACLNDDNLPDMEMETFCIDRETGKTDKLEANFNFFNYRFNAGEKKFIRIRNLSSSYHFSMQDDRQIEFPVLGGSFSIYMEKAGENRGMKMQASTFTIVDCKGRNLLSAENNHRITDIRLNGTIIPREDLSRVQNNRLTLLINPAARNRLSFSLINSDGRTEECRYLLFPGIQIITVR